MSKSLLTVLFSAVALLSVALPAQAPESSPQPELLTRVFGREGDPGSFNVRMQTMGGGIQSLHLLDHFRSVEAGNRQVHESGDYMLLVWNGGTHALALQGSPAQTGFPAPLETTVWQHRDIGNDGIEFWLESGTGLTLRRTLRHDPQARGFELTIALENTGATPGGRVSFDLLGPALVNPSTTRTIGNASIALAVPLDGEPLFVGPAAGQLQPLPGEDQVLDVHALSFAGSTSRFFGAFLTPRNEVASQVLSALYVETGPRVREEALNMDANTVTWVRYGLGFTVPEQGRAVEAKFGLYLGPKSYRVFGDLPEPERFEPVLDIDLTAPCCAIPGARPMAKLLLTLLSWFHDLVNNWGVAVIMLTILVRGLLFPVNFHMQKSMRAYGTKMAKLKPKMDELKKKHANDPKAHQQAMMAFQREHKVMPPLGGCIPVFATMPVYIGLFTALRVAYDLRQQPFAFWIQDLSLSDALFPLPFWPHVFNLLPLLWIGLFLLMSLRQPMPTDPQQRSMQRMMRIMPLMFGFMLYGYASALLLYMVTSMLWSLVESAMVKKILGPMDPNVASMAPTPM